MTQNQFDIAASDWDANPNRRGISENSARLIVESGRLSPEMKGLDFGAGTGLLSVILSRHLKEILAVDSSQGMLDVLSQKTASHGIKNIHPHFLDIEKDNHVLLEKHAGSVDVIFSAMTLHHIENIPALVQMFLQLTRPQSHLFIADLDKEDGSFHGGNNDGIHHFGFEREELAETLTKNGYSEIVFHDVFTVKHESNREYPVFLCYAKRK